MTGEKDPQCHACCPETFVNDPRSRILMYMCQYHLSLVEHISEEVLKATLEEGMRQRRAVEEAERYSTFNDKGTRYR